MHNSQTYSQYDIGRYLQRKMSPQEMHDFERALMDDPFLADAIEGFSSTDRDLAGKHLRAIESELRGTKEKAKVVALHLKKTAGWKVAAIVLLVVLGSALTYSIVTKKGLSNNKELASASAVKEETKDSIGPVDKSLAQANVMLQKDLVANQEVNPPFQTAPTTGERQYKGAGAVSKSDGSTGMEKAAIEENESSSSVAATQSASSAYEQTLSKGITMAMPPTVPPQEFKGKVLDATGEPVPFASVRGVNNPVGAVADAKGDFTIKAPDSVIRVNVNSVGYAGVTTEIKSNTAVNRVILEEEKSSLSDVVVTSLQSKKERRSHANSHAPNTAEPIGGWKSFEQYMHRQIDSLKADNSGEMYDEDVELEFSIDKEGRPTNIKAVSPADKIITEKAVQILSKGPKWENRTKEKKVKVIIPF
jgi:hypothetical protein